MARKQKLDLDALLTKIVELLLRHSPQELSFSRVSRLTRVPRSTLYYYFGSSREAMIEQAVKFWMEKFVQLMTLTKTSDYSDWESFQEARLKSSTQLVQKYPWAPHLYFRYRNDPGKLGDRIRQIEIEYVNRLASSWKNYAGKPADVLAVRLSSYLKLGLLWGLAVDGSLWFTGADETAIYRVVDVMTRASTEIMSKEF